MSFLKKSVSRQASLGAGDLIDRSVRIYRKNFWSFVLIASPPIVVGGIFLVGWMTLARNLFAVGASNPVESSMYQIFIGLGGFVIWLIQLIAVFAVMGGASRNFVRHVLFGEAITFRETYKNVRRRFFGLIGVSALLVFFLGIFGLIVLNIALIGVVLAAALAVAVFQFAEILQFVGAIVASGLIVFAALWLFFLVASRFVYIPQAMLVEGRTAFAAISRSVNLARRNVRRVAALFIFTLVATYSALALFYIPLGWYVWFSGVNIQDLFTADTVPAWYEISTQVITEISLILLTPVLMIGLCLLYIDERIRQEGFDIELLAVRWLGGVPTAAETSRNPLQPALAERISTASGSEKNAAPPGKASVLGLE